MKGVPDPHYRHRFPAEIISHAVWLYHTFCLSFRDVELMLAERGVVVSDETIRRWCRKFAQTFANRLRRRILSSDPVPASLRCGRVPQEDVGPNRRGADHTRAGRDEGRPSSSRTKKELKR